MALKEQANKKKSPRNKNDKMRDGKSLEQSILKYEENPAANEELVKDTDETTYNL